MGNPAPKLRIETQVREETRMMNKQGLCLLALLTVLLAAHAQGECQMKFCREVKEDGNKMVKYNYKMEEPSCADMCGYTKEGDNSGDIWCLKPKFVERMKLQLKLLATLLMLLLVVLLLKILLLPVVLPLPPPRRMKQRRLIRKSAKKEKRLANNVPIKLSN